MDSKKCPCCKNDVDVNSLIGPDTNNCPRCGWNVFKRKPAKTAAKKIEKLLQEMDKSGDAQSVCIAEFLREQLPSKVSFLICCAEELRDSAKYFIRKANKAMLASTEANLEWERCKNVRPNTK